MSAPMRMQRPPQNHGGRPLVQLALWLLCGALTWTMDLAVIGYRVLLGLPARLSVSLVLIWLFAALPVAALLLRPYAG